MSTFIKSTAFETAFDGDQVTCRFRPMEQADSLRWVALMTPEKTFLRKDLIPFFAEILPKYVEEFSGVRTPDGTKIELGDVVRYTFFSRLIIEMGMALQATGTAPDPKASALQPGDSSAA